MGPFPAPLRRTLSVSQGTGIGRGEFKGRDGIAAGGFLAKHIGLDYPGNGMRSWTIDADDIQVAEDFDASPAAPPNWIDDFLAPARDEKFIVIGTKGFGKTLLLKAKRVVYQQSKSTVCLPENSLLDKPIGDKIFSADMIELYGHSTDKWRKVWLISIAAAVLKRLDLARRRCAVNAASRGAASLTSSLHSVIDHFVNLLDFRAAICFRSGDRHGQPTGAAPARASTRRSRPSSTTSTSTSTSTSSRAPARASDAGELSPNIWYLRRWRWSKTAYQLRRVNHHIKVFAAVRKEAFRKFDDDDADGAAVSRQHHRHQLHARQPARDLRQQHPQGEGAQPGRPGAAALQSGRGFLGRPHV